MPVLTVAVQVLRLVAIGQERTATSNDSSASTQKTSEPATATSNERLSQMTGWWFGDCPLFQTHPDRPLVMRLEIRNQVDKSTDFTAEISATHRGFPIGFRKSLSWDATSNRFSGELPLPKAIFGADSNGVIVVHVTPADESGQLNCQLVPDQDAKAAIEQAVRTKTIPDRVGQSYEDSLAFSFARISSAQKLDAKDVIVVETMDGLAALSKKVGTWAHVSIPLLNNGKMRLDVVRYNDEFALAETDDGLYGYCSRIAKWGRLAIPSEFRGKVKTEVGMGSLTARMGNKIYSFSPVTGRWASPEGDVKEPSVSSPRRGMRGRVVNDDDEQAITGTVAGTPANKSGEGGFFPTIGLDDNVGFFPGAADLDKNGKPASMERMGRGGVNRDSKSQQRSSAVEAETPVATNPAATASSKAMKVSGNGVTLIETSDGLAGYSDKLGKWDRVTVRPRSDGQTRLVGAIVGARAAAVVVNNELLGFQADHGRWVRFQFPEEAMGKIVGPRVGMGVVGVRIGKDVLAINGQSKQWSRLTIADDLDDRFAPVVGIDSVDLVVGDKFYKLSSTTGEWTSPDDGLRDKSNGLEGHPGEVIDSSVRQNWHVAGSAAIIDLSQKIKQLESQAALHANQVRALLQQQGPDNAQVVEAKNELKRKLDEALDLRFQREQMRIQELRSQLGRLEQQVGQRKAQRTAIVERRVIELLEGESLRWDASEGAFNENTSEVKSNSAVTSTNAVSATAASAPTAIELLLRNKDAHPGTTGRTATELVRAQASQASSSVPPIGTDLLLDVKKLQDFASQFSLLRRQITQTNEKLNRQTLKLEELEKANIDDRNPKQIEEIRSSIESLKNHLKEVTGWAKLIQLQLAAGRRDLELQISAAKLVVEQFEKLSSSRGVMAERTIREAKLKADQAKLIIERLMNQVELLNEVEKQADGQ